MVFTILPNVPDHASRYAACQSTHQGFPGVVSHQISDAATQCGTADTTGSGTVITSKVIH